MCYALTPCNNSLAPSAVLVVLVLLQVLVGPSDVAGPNFQVGQNLISFFSGAPRIRQRGAPTGCVGAKPPAAGG